LQIIAETALFTRLYLFGFGFVFIFTSNLNYMRERKNDSFFRMSCFV